MKKNITVLFFLLLAVCGATGVFAQSESDFTVTVIKGEVFITGYTGKGAVVVIPATIGGIPIEGILWGAFANHKGIISISIPPGITVIPLIAFKNCTDLISISIPSSVTLIGGGAFEGCTNLRSITIGANVKLIEYSFDNGFIDYYDTNGKKAGIYIFRNGAWSYDAQ